MRVELPELKRCCCCIPLRYGLLAWGYIKLIIVLAVFLVYLILAYRLFNMAVFLMARGYPAQLFGIQIAIYVATILTLLTDICLTIVFVVGSHRKSAKLLKVFYIYSIVILCVFVLLHMAISSYQLYRFSHSIPTSKTPAEMRGAFLLYGVKTVVAMIVLELAQIGSQCYLILLIRSEIFKLSDNCKFTFTNIADEAKCSLEKETVIKIERETDGFKNGTDDYKDGINDYSNNGTGGYESGTDHDYKSDRKLEICTDQKESLNYRRLE